MEFTLEVCQRVADYLKDKYGWELSAREVLAQNEWHKIVGLGWEASVHFNEPGWHRSLDEIEDPKPDTTYWIVKDGNVDRYRFETGRGFVDIGGMNESMYKS